MAFRTLSSQAAEPHAQDGVRWAKSFTTRFLGGHGALLDFAHADGAGERAFAHPTRTCFIFIDNRIRKRGVLE